MLVHCFVLDMLVLTAITSSRKNKLQVFLANYLFHRGNCADNLHIRNTSIFSESYLISQLLRDCTARLQFFQ